MRTDTLEIRLEPSPRAPSLARVFVAKLMDHAGLDDLVIQDVRIVVSDLVTSCLAGQTPMSLTAELDAGYLRMSGPASDGMPASGALLGESLSVDENSWQIRLAIP